MANAKTDTGAVTVKKETAMVAASFLEQRFRRYSTRRPCDT